MSLYLQSIIDGDRYLILTDSIIEIVPFVIPKKVPHAPDYILGMIDYRGDSLPLVDMCQLMVDRPCKKSLSARIVVGKYHDKNYGELVMGWLFEGITETLRIDDKLFSPPSVNVEDAHYLGDIATDSNGILQRLEIDQVLTDEVKKVLFGSADGGA